MTGKIIFPIELFATSCTGERINAVPG
jgi:hypothetical protein